MNECKQRRYDGLILLNFWHVKIDMNQKNANGKNEGSVLRYEEICQEVERKAAQFPFKIITLNPCNCLPVRPNFFLRRLNPKALF